MKHREEVTKSSSTVEAELQAQLNALDMEEFDLSFSDEDHKNSDDELHNVQKEREINVIKSPEAQGRPLIKETSAKKEDERILPSNVSRNENQSTGDFSLDMSNNIQDKISSGKKVESNRGMETLTTTAPVISSTKEQVFMGVTESAKEKNSGAESDQDDGDILEDIKDFSDSWDDELGDDSSLDIHLNNNSPDKVKGNINSQNNSNSKTESSGQKVINIKDNISMTKENNEIEIRPNIQNYKENKNNSSLVAAVDDEVTSSKATASSASPTSDKMSDGNSVNMSVEEFTSSLIQPSPDQKQTAAASPELNTNRNSLSQHDESMDSIKVISIFDKSKTHDESAKIRKEDTQDKGSSSSQHANLEAYQKQQDVEILERKKRISELEMSLIHEKHRADVANNTITELRGQLSAESLVSRRDAEVESSVTIKKLQIELANSNGNIKRFEEEVEQYKLRIAQFENRAVAAERSQLEYVRDATSKMEEKLGEFYQMHRKDIDEDRKNAENDLNECRQRHSEELQALKSRNADVHNLNLLVDRVAVLSTTIEKSSAKIDAEHNKMDSIVSVQLVARERTISEYENTARDARARADAEAAKLEQLLLSMETAAVHARRGFSEEKTRLAEEHARLEALQLAIRTESEITHAELEKERKELRAEQLALRVEKKETQEMLS